MQQLDIIIMEDNKIHNSTLEYPLNTKEDEKQGRDITKEYTENTTAHGPPHVAKAKGRFLLGFTKDFICLTSYVYRL